MIKHPDTQVNMLGSLLHGKENITNKYIIVSDVFNLSQFNEILILFFYNSHFYCILTISAKA